MKVQWLYPQAFYFILPVTLAWFGLALSARSRRKRAAAAFVSASMTDRILPPDSPERFWLKTILWGGGIIFGTLALARPQFGEYYEEVKVKGSDLYIIVDVSRSMLAEDVAPSRLGRAKSDISDLLNRLHGERVGLIAFAGRAAVTCPLTTDYHFFRIALNELGPNSVTKGGTAIGDAIRKAMNVMPKDVERDQALLLITDGDDQDSYPLEAAAEAAERRITIFTVGLGDDKEGSRVPEKEHGKTFVQHEGQTVWSKMNNTLLGQIATKTSGAYVPARTMQYDLGHIYDEYLSRMKGENGPEQRRVRLAEQYQIFLALCMICLLLEILIRPYAMPAAVPATLEGEGRRERSERGVRGSVAAILMLSSATFGLNAADPPALVREGLSLYNAEKFDEAAAKFEEAASKAGREMPLDSAVAAFNHGCALLKRGEREKASSQFLQAGQTRDKDVSAAAHFNLGCVAADEAKSKAGEKPEDLEAEKRDEVVKVLLTAVGHYRSCLDIDPQHPGARKNIELIRMWVKYYTDKWHEMDRKKRRDETNLLQFVEFLIQAEKQLREQSKPLTDHSSLDKYAELKRAQDELIEEINPLKEKIRDEISKQDDAPKPEKGNPLASAEPEKKDEEKEKRQEALKQLLDQLLTWADDAGKKMDASSNRLNSRKGDAAAVEQKVVIENLEHIWEVGVPFQSLLGNNIDDQDKILSGLKPDEDDKKEERGDKKSASPAAEKKDQSAAPKPVAPPAEKKPVPLAPKQSAPKNAAPKPGAPATPAEEGKLPKVKT